jgi:hypothetical protein
MHFAVQASTSFRVISPAEAMPEANAIANNVTNRTKFFVIVGIDISPPRTSYPPGPNIDEIDLYGTINRNLKIIKFTRKTGLVQHRVT